MNIIADRVKERISGSPGTSSTLTLSAAPIGFRRFSSVMSIGDTCYAVIENGAAWEIGIYTYSAANTLTRTTVLKSSNSGALISVGSNAFVFISYIADKAVYLNPSGEANLALSALNDVGLTAPASGQSLVYNGSSWANTTITGYTTEEAQDAVGGILTDTSSISFSYNDGAPSIAASVRSSGITDVMISGGVDALKIGSGSVSSAEFGYLDGVTSSLQVQLDSKYGSANPSGYLTASVASATYQPLDSDLTSIASTGVDSYGIGLLTKTSGSGVRNYIGAGTSSFDGAYGSLSGVPSTFAPSAHTHGNITNAGAIGSTTGLPIVTTASGVLTAGSFGTTAGTFAAGDDSRITGALSTSTAAATYAVIAAGQPISGTVGQVLAKNSGTNYDSSWTSLVLGDRYLSTSTTSNAVSNGTKTFTIGTGLAYTPTQNITIAYDATNHMHGEVTTYNSGTGVLVVDINNHTGTGTYTSWVVNVGGVTPATVVSWGDIIGTLGTQSDLSTALNAKLEITTAASTYLPLAGGTLTGPITGTSNTVQFRSSTTAQLVEVFNTYTSATSLETFRVKANAGAAYQIGSAVGSAGGTNRAIEIGHYDSAGTFTSALSIATTGDATFAKSITVTKGAGAYTSTFTSGSNSDNYNQFLGSSGSLVAEYGLYAGYLYFQSLTGLSGTRFYSNNTISAQFTLAGVTLSQGVATSGSPTTLTVTGAAHTTLALSTEATDVNFNLARTVQFATGALTTQRAVRIQAPTYSFVGASTITTASTLSISGPPVAGTNATITNAYALNVESGNAYFAGKIIVDTVGPGSAAEILFGLTAYISSSRSGSAYGTQHLGGTYQGSYFIRDDITGAGFGWGATSSSIVQTPSLIIVRDASDVLAQRRGTNAQTLRVYNTYTSATSFENLQFKAVAAAAYQIGSAKGSAGGSNQAVEVGHWDAAGAFTRVINVSTNNRVGIGTSSPGTTLDVASASGGINTGIRLIQLAENGTAVSSYISIDFAVPTSGLIGQFFATANNYSNAAVNLPANSVGLFAEATNGTALLGAGGANGDVRFNTGGYAIANERMRISPNGSITFTPGVSTTGSPTAFTLTGAAHTTLTLSTEATDVNFNLARTVEFATGALTTQRAMRVQAPTYSFVGASTITQATTLSVSGGPIAGTNATINSSYSIYSEAGLVGSVGDVVVTSATGAFGVRSGPAGSNRIQMKGGSGVEMASTCYIAWGLNTTNVNSLDTYLYRDGVAILAQRNGTNAQTFRLYNTYTSSTSYETLNIKGKASANFEIGPENGSAGGTLRGLTIGGYAAGTSTIAPWLTFTNAGVATFGSCSTVREFNVTGVSYFERGGSTMWFEINPNYALAANTAAFDASKAMAFYVNSGIAPFLALSIATTGLSTFAGPIASTKAIYFTSEPTGTPAGTTQTLTLADGNHQTLALTSATGTVTATLTVPTGSSSGTIIVKQHASAAKDITWAVSAGTIKWMGTQPTWSSDAVSAVRLVSWRWDGSIMYLAATDVGT